MKLHLLLAFALIALASSAGVTMSSCAKADCTDCTGSETIAFGKSLTTQNTCVKVAGNCSAATVTIHAGGCDGTAVDTTNVDVSTGVVCKPSGIGTQANKYECSPAAALQPVAWLAALCAFFATRT